MSKTVSKAASAAPDPAEVLLLGLIQECHTVIREVLTPAARGATGHQCTRHIADIATMVRAGADLSDAILRLRGGEPERPPELRQRITVERIQSLPGGGASRPVPVLSAPEGEGG